MRKVLLILLVLTFVSCKPNINNKQKKSHIPITDTVIESAVIYEANIRQYSPEGTFNAFAKDIPSLKELGVKIIWLMPINPISKIKRKAKGDLFASEIKDENERKKYLGSYYSVSDYSAINPEFGNLTDFKNLVKIAHKNNMFVILDWVPNHTGWDHPWIYENPEWYTQNEKGEIIDPINPETGKSWGWTDVADLNYENMEMRQAMLDDLKYWVNETDIDGYRMDVAHKVPVDFFEKVTAELKLIKPVFMLAEAEQPNLLTNAFDMHYGWEVHHVFNKIAKGEATIKDFDLNRAKTDSILQKDDINMNFITNHDENSWSGSLMERMPNNKEIFTALIYTMPGMPLIYSGQEYDINFRLKFFEKDEIPKNKSDYYEVLKKLGSLKNNSSALHTGKNPASYKRFSTDSNNTLVFKRHKDKESLIFAGNFSNKTTPISLPTGTYFDYMEKAEITISEQSIQFKAWEYKILIEE